MFDIVFDDTGSPLPSGVTGCDWAAIRIEDFQESLIIPTHYWTRLNYYLQWQAACIRVLSGDPVAVFLVGVNGVWPLTHLLFSWVIYVEHGELCVHNVMLFPDRFPDAGFENAQLAVPKRQSHSDGPDTQGEQISEWRTTPESIASFASRLQERIDEQKRKR